MVMTMTPVCCGMAGCDNPVDSPEMQSIVVKVDENSTIQIPTCKQCHARLGAAGADGFSFYSMN